MKNKKFIKPVRVLIFSIYFLSISYYSYSDDRYINGAPASDFLEYNYGHNIDPDENFSYQLMVTSESGEFNVGSLNFWVTDDLTNNYEMWDYEVNNFHPANGAGSMQLGISGTIPSNTICGQEDDITVECGYLDGNPLSLHVLFTLTYHIGIEYPSTLTLSSWLSLETVYNASASSQINLEPGFRYEAYASSQNFNATIATCNGSKRVNENGIESINYQQISKQDAAKLSFIDSNITIFPNPASTNIVIENKSNYEKMVTLSLTNIQGQEVFFEIINLSSPFTIDMSDLSVGVYYMKLQNEDENFVSKILIQR